MSELKFSCANCSQHLSCDENCAGQQITCPSCRQTITVPALPPAIASGPNDMKPPFPPFSGTQTTRTERAMFTGIHRIEYIHTLGPGVTFDCSACGAQSVSASTQGTVERFLSFRLIPLFRVRYTDITCGRCGQLFRVEKPLEAVVAMPPDEISRRIRTKVPTFAKYLIVIGLAVPLLVAGAAATAGVFGSEALASLVFAGVSFIGFVLCGTGLAVAARKPTRWRFVGAIGLAPFLISILFMLVRGPTELSRQSAGPVRTGPVRPESHSGFITPSRPEMGRPSMRNNGGTTFSVGDKVEANWANRWRPAVVAQLHGPMVSLRFEDSEVPRELTLPATQVRARK